MSDFNYAFNTNLNNPLNYAVESLGSLEGNVYQEDTQAVSGNRRLSIPPAYMTVQPYQSADYGNSIKSENTLQQRHIKSFRQVPSQRATEIYQEVYARTIDAGKIAGQVATVVTGAVTQGVAQMVVDGNAWRAWGLEKSQEWGWNDSKFGQACGIVLSAASLAGGVLVGAVRGSWEGGKQAYQSHQAGQGAWQIIQQSFSNAFYASEPTRFGTAYDTYPTHQLPLRQDSILSTVPSSADLLQR